MANGVLIQDSVMAKDIDSLNRTAKSAADINNGYALILASKEAGVGELDVWAATQPATGTLEGLWMAYSPELVLTGDKYKGLDPDPRNFTNIAGDVFDVFKPMIGDIITLTADALSGSVNTHVIAADSAYTLAWNAGVAASTLSLLLIKTTSISIGLGTIATQKVTAYQFEVVHN